MTQEAPNHPANHHRYITTFSGVRIGSTIVTEDQIDKHDMVRGLAMQVRYLGQIKRFYSIAEHSVLVSELLEAHNYSREVQIAGLLHDGHEYLTGDFPSPYKYDVKGLRSWEYKIEVTFRNAMGLPYQGDSVWQVVKIADLVALHYEAGQLMRDPPAWYDEKLAWQVPAQLRVLYSGLGVPWERAAQLFSERARMLGLSGFEL